MEDYIDMSSLGVWEVPFVTEREAGCIRTQVSTELLAFSYLSLLPGRVLQRKGPEVSQVQGNWLSRQFL